MLPRTKPDLIPDGLKLWVRPDDARRFEIHGYAVYDYSMDHTKVLLRGTSGKLAPQLTVDLAVPIAIPSFVPFTILRGGDDLFAEGSYHLPSSITYGLDDKIFNSLLPMYYMAEMLNEREACNAKLLGCPNLSDYGSRVVYPIPRTPMVVLDIANNVILCNDSNVNLRSLITASYLHLRDSL